MRAIILFFGLMLLGLGAKSQICKTPGKPVFSSSPSLVCSGSNYTLSVNTDSSAHGYQWTLPEGTDILGSDSSNKISFYVGPNSGRYIVRAFNGCGPSDTSSVYIRVSAPLKIVSGPKDFTFCQAETVSLTVHATGEDLRFEWEVQKDTNSNDLISHKYLSGLHDSVLVIHKMDNLNKMYFRCIVSGGCDQKDTSRWAKLSVEMSDFLPNVITPNGDGVNDALTLKLSDVKSFKGIVFNRYGKQVYRFESPTDSWNASFNGSIVDNGTYFYILFGYCSSNNQPFKKKGSVEIMR